MTYVAVYMRHWVRYEAEFDNLVEAESFLKYGEDMGWWAPVGVEKRP